MSECIALLDVLRMCVKDGAHPSAACGTCNERMCTTLKQCKNEAILTDQAQIIPDGFVDELNWLSTMTPTGCDGWSEFVYTLSEMSEWAACYDRFDPCTGMVPDAKTPLPLLP